MNQEFMEVVKILNVIAEIIFIFAIIKHILNKKRHNEFNIEETTRKLNQIFIDKQKQIIDFYERKDDEYWKKRHSMHAKELYGIDEKTEVFEEAIEFINSEKFLNRVIKRINNMQIKGKR